jgi:hypothetical protein
MHAFWVFFICWVALIVAVLSIPLLARILGAAILIPARHDAVGASERRLLVPMLRHRRARPEVVNGRRRHR